VGECALLAGDLGNAYHALHEHARTSQMDAVAHYHLALAHERLGMHQAAERGYIQAIAAGAGGTALSGLAALSLERAHIAASKQEAPPQGEAGRELRRLCAGNDFACHANPVHDREPWRRDGVALDLMKTLRFSEADITIPRANVLQSDHDLVIAAGLEYEMADRRMPLQGLYTARLWNMTIGAGGLLCNGTHALSSSRLRRPHAGVLRSEPVCGAHASPVRRIALAAVLFERWGTQWQHFMQDMSHKFVFVLEQLQHHPSAFLVMEAVDRKSNVYALMKPMLRKYGISEERLVFFDQGCLTAMRLHCREYLHIDQLLLTEVHPVGWIMGQVPPVLGQLLHKAIITEDVPVTARRKSVILHRREDGSRSFSNLEEVRQVMAEVASAHGLDTDIEVVYGDALEIFEMRELLQQARLIVAPHGGQTYNVAFASPGTVFVEVVPGQRTHDGPYTIHSYSASLGHQYWLLPIPGRDHRDERGMQVPSAKLRQILSNALG